LALYHNDAYIQGQCKMKLKPLHDVTDVHCVGDK